jgi:hypothetical protein
MDEPEIVRRARAAHAKLHALTRQSEDYIWRPAVEASAVLADVITLYAGLAAGRPTVVKVESAPVFHDDDAGLAASGRFSPASPTVLKPPPQTRMMRRDTADRC